MFSSQIVSSDEFLDMPISSQGLYFHLGMAADDDGFVTPRKVLRMIGAGDDDLKVLAAKGFVIPFESGVIVIKHWKQNNYIQKDRYTPTIYGAEAARLTTSKNVYILYTGDIQPVSILDAQEGRKVERQEILSLNRERNADAIAPQQLSAHFAKGREILKQKRRGGSR